MILTSHIDLSMSLITNELKPEDVLSLVLVTIDCTFFSYQLHKCRAKIIYNIFIGIRPHYCRSIPGTSLVMSKCPIGDGPWFWPKLKLHMSRHATSQCTVVISRYRAFPICISLPWGLTGSLHSFLKYCNFLRINLFSTQLP